MTCTHIFTHALTDVLVISCFLGILVTYAEPAITTLRPLAKLVDPDVCARACVACVDTLYSCSFSHTHAHTHVRTHNACAGRAVPLLHSDGDITDSCLLTHVLKLTHTHTHIQRYNNGQHATASECGSSYAVNMDQYGL